MKRPLALTVLALASTLALVGCGTSGEEKSGAASEASTSAAAGIESTAAFPSPASSSSEEIAVEHNDADTMFAQRAIPHHEKAVQLSKVMVAKKNINPQVHALADQILATQGPEIERLQEMLETWEEPPSTESGPMDQSSELPTGMGGTMTEKDLQQLEDAEGDEAARLFLTLMTGHHRGAIDMAKEEVANGQNPQAIGAAQKAIDDQEVEIQEMDNLLQQF